MSSSQLHANDCGRTHTVTLVATHNGQAHVRLPAFSMRMCQLFPTAPPSHCKTDTCPSSPQSSTRVGTPHETCGTTHVSVACALQRQSAQGSTDVWEQGNSNSGSWLSATARGSAMCGPPGFKVSPHKQQILAGGGLSWRSSSFLLQYCTRDGM